MRALALAALLAIGAPAAAVACSMPGNAAALMADAGAAMNAQRKAGGRKQLGRDAKLDEAAQSHACWMAANDTFSHKGAGGSLPKRRIKATGYQTRLTAENIAWGQSSGGEVIAEWMASSGHRKNILLNGVDEYGVGVALMNGRPVWVMVYAAN
jgi:uncharacterized protein YkwD